MSSTPYVLLIPFQLDIKISFLSKSRRKLKHTDCFNSPAFIELFKKLRLEGEGSDLNNQPGSNSTVDNIVLQDSTTPSSCDHTTGQAGVPNHTLPKPPRVTLPAENTSPTATVTSGTDRKSRKKFYVVTCGRRTGVFDNWSVIFISSQLLLNPSFLF